MKNSVKRLIILALSVLLIAAAMPMHISATTVTPLEGLVSVTDSKNTAKLSDGTVTATVVGKYSISRESNTIKIVNISNVPANISFDYEASSANSFTIAGVSVATSGSYSVLLFENEELTIVLGSRGKTQASVTLSNFSYEVSTASYNVTIDYDNTLASVTAGSEQVTSGAVKDVTLSDGIELTATVKNGATFYGWVNKATGEVLSTAATLSLKPTSDIAVKPIVSNGSTAVFTIGSAHLFDDLNNAITTASANSTKTIVLKNNGTLPAGTYTIPSGITLLIPFDSSNTLYTDKPASVDYTAYTTPTVYRTLTMASGAKIIVNGAISVSAKHAAAQGGRGGCKVTGAYGHIKMEDGSNITVNSGGYLYAWGYITGKGTVTANNGSHIREYFQFSDFRGGTQTSDMQNGVFPLNQYYVQNIEVPLTLYAGAEEKSYTTLVIKLTFGEDLTFIGKDDAMFKLTSGSVTKWYDGSTDRLMIESNGDISVSPIEITIGYGSLLGAEINTKDYELPFSSNMTLKANNGTISIAQDVAFFPGSEVIVAEEVNCTIAEGVNVYVYDADDWGNFSFGNGSVNAKFHPLPYAPGRTYNRTNADLKDAMIQIDGVIDASKGHVYTTAGGANIYSTKNGKVLTNAGTETATYQLVQGTGYTQIPITPAKVKNADGTYTQTYTDTYNYANGSWDGECEHENCSSVVTDPTCTTDGSIVHTCICGYSYTETIEAVGHNYEYKTTTKPTCTQKGVMTGTCLKCGDTYTEEIPAIGHSYSSATTTDPTCTEKGVLTYTCANCGDTYTEEIAANGHAYDKEEVTTKPTCDKEGVTTHTCSACGDSYTTSIDAIGHNYVESGTTAPTCTDAGYTTYTCSHCGDSYKDNEVSALGHTPGAKATCTTAQVCTVCGTELVAAHHEYADEFTVDTESTHTTEGSKSKHCAHCDSVTEVTVIPMIICDINDDGIVDKTETIKLRRYLLDIAELTDEEMFLFDMNDDGIIDVLDLIALNDYIAVH